ncbi:unnamed protein product [Rhizophagus irregularis]|nr:unnamed protein product [Rhizophagus irregularis]CAB5370794.1 unnamed protein product [Rhizophagus irregularis]
MLFLPCFDTLRDPLLAMIRVYCSNFISPFSMKRVYYNTKPTNVIILDAITFTANSVAFHPGCDGRFSVARFTAPKDGNYAISATFAHISSCAEHSGAYIVYNNLMTLWEVDLAGPRDSKSFKTTNSRITIRANEPINFIVGVGLDNTCHCDMTSARVDIQLLDTLENQP